MPEPTQISFSHKEVATALLKEQKIHDGIWGVYIRFGIKGMNIGANDEDLQPSAIVPVLSIGLQKFDKVNNLSVDAAEVNPAPITLKRIGAGKTSAAKKKR
jgi:hypothetical protein